MKATGTANRFKTSDIKIHVDSVGFFECRHKFQGMLIDGAYYESRGEARREAVKVLREIQEFGPIDHT